MPGFPIHPLLMYMSHFHLFNRFSLGWLTCTMLGVDDGVGDACPCMFLLRTYYDVMLTKVECHHEGWEKLRYQTEDWVVKKWWKRKSPLKPVGSKAS